MGARPKLVKGLRKPAAIGKGKEAQNSKPFEERPIVYCWNLLFDACKKNGIDLTLPEHAAKLGSLDVIDRDSRFASLLLQKLKGTERRSSPT